KDYPYRIGFGKRLPLFQPVKESRRTPVRPFVVCFPAERTVDSLWQTVAQFLATESDRGRGRRISQLEEADEKPFRLAPRVPGGRCRGSAVGWQRQRRLGAVEVAHCLGGKLVGIADSHCSGTVG